jgi:hypothetical protein
MDEAAAAKRPWSDATQVKRLREMLEWREQKSQDAGARTSAAQHHLAAEVSALRYAVTVLEQLVPTTESMVVPQGLWSDHHAAIHTECQWDWIAALESIARHQAELERAAAQEPPAPIRSPHYSSDDPTH